jgi:hypothetical protein
VLLASIAQRSVSEQNFLTSIEKQQDRNWISPVSLLGFDVRVDEPLEYTPLVTEREGVVGLEDRKHAIIT